MADWIIRRLSAEDKRPAFDCGEQDLNEFFAVDSIKRGRELLSVTYVVMDKNENAIAFFSLSNDSIRRDELKPAIFKKLIKKSHIRNDTQVYPLSKLAGWRPALAIKEMESALKSWIFSNTGLPMAIRRDVDS